VTQQVLDVGNCDPDFASIRNFLSRRFGCEVVRAHNLKETLDQLRQGDYALVLVNRKLDCDYSDGIEIIRALQADADFQSVPVMLITNFSEHQDAAVAVGAKRGFGKLEFEQPETLSRLDAILSPNG